ncbi:cell division protein ZipA C-terminal FtsZ-binding domain-containing protein [Acinetobacter sp. ANC 4178]|uniref:cell division protein ZipA C-terminal FtsZ-binding domain-containing protein n=1 Tax=Acinetobacter sp. ANC 4178 TaxID=2529839 RepID=UPI00103C609E|nr:cell division protein ZipA C-terminal FtsZ-binding domain-containing protein [Acinetobacter sp. ANC 4178]TCB67090.1 cell division protein ZipA [Acinetobacter sp. ANC 4178]
MEVTTIVGIVIAVIIILVGLRMLFKKPASATPSLDSELQVNSDSQLPIIPRHVRDQLQTSTEVTERVEPTLNDAEVVAEITEKHEPKVVMEKQQATEIAVNTNAETTTEAAQKETVVDAKVTAKVEENVPVENAEEGLHLTAHHIEKAEIVEFNEESSILDEHLHEQQRVDEESVLQTAEEFIVFNIYPERRVLTGDKTLKVLLKYGLRYGEMACFHRYDEEHEKLSFSVLQITEEGPAGFDLETLANEQVKGLAFFLALPHNDVQNAFDTMVSISNLIAREIDGTIYDQNQQEMTAQSREFWRHQAIDYRSGQQATV